MRQLAAAWCLAMATGSVAAIDVDTQADPSGKFSEYRTYAWKPGRLLDVSDERREMVDRWIRSAIDEALAASGLEPVQDGPDLWVTYVGNTDVLPEAPSSKKAIAAHEFDYEQGPLGIYGWNAAEGRPATRATLLVDLVDVDADKLVWRANCTGAIKPGSGKTEKTVRRAVKQAFRSYPPRSD